MIHWFKWFSFGQLTKKLSPPFNTFFINIFFTWNLFFLFFKHTVFMYIYNSLAFNSSFKIDWHQKKFLVFMLSFFKLLIFSFYRVVSVPVVPLPVPFSVVFEKVIWYFASSLVITYFKHLFADIWILKHLIERTIWVLVLYRTVCCMQPHTNDIIP